MPYFSVGIRMGKLEDNGNAMEIPSLGLLMNIEREFGHCMDIEWKQDLTLWSLR